MVSRLLNRFFWLIVLFVLVRDVPGVGSPPKPRRMALEGLPGAPVALGARARQPKKHHIRCRALLSGHVVPFFPKAAITSRSMALVCWFVVPLHGVQTASSKEVELYVTR